jgi:hypothetical protein
MALPDFTLLPGCAFFNKTGLAIDIPKHFYSETGDG